MIGGRTRKALRQQLRKKKIIKCIKERLLRIRTRKVPSLLGFEPE